MYFIDRMINNTLLIRIICCPVTIGEYDSVRHFRKQDEVQIATLLPREWCIHSKKLDAMYHTPAITNHTCSHCSRKTCKEVA